MAAFDPPWGRPLLTVRRADTVRMCADLGLTPHKDPHNVDPAFTRVQLRREVLPLLEDVLGGGVAQALARTAAALREDGALLDRLGAQLADRAAVDGGLSVQTLAAADPALRRRAVRAWLTGHGVTALTDVTLRGIDELVAGWRGQGPVAVPFPGRSRSAEDSWNRSASEDETGPPSVRDGAPGVRLAVVREHGRLTLCTTTTSPRS
jgi:tRNA(Ile)-lysidine synthase